MASRARSIKFSADLEEASNLQAEKLGFNNWSEYLKSLIRFDIYQRSSLNRGRLKLKDFKGMDVKKQDRVDKALLEDLKKVKL